MELDKNLLTALKRSGSRKALKAPSFLPCPLEKLLVRSLAGGCPVLGSDLHLSRWPITLCTEKIDTDASCNLKEDIDMAGMTSLLLPNNL